MKPLILLFVLCLALTVGYSRAGQVNAFIYHRFDENRYPSTNIPADIFRQQLEYLKNNKIQMISLGQVAALLSENRDLPAHAAALCVDDAYRSFYDVAMPILREYGYPITLFVNTDAVGTSGYLTWSEIAELAAEGVEIGNHTASHAYLVERETGETNQQWLERVRQDILKAQQAFEQHLGVTPKLFAYPYGEYSSPIVELIVSFGFQAAFAQQSGVIHPGHHRFILPRFPMGGPFATVEGFSSKLHMKALVARQENPFDPVVDQNPPVLSLDLGQVVDPKRFNCFVQGENQCHVETDSGKGEGWYRVVADQQLTGRRNKYTLTLQTGQGDWLWYSHPWINASYPGGAE